MSNAADFKNGVKPNWCPGCGHFGIQNAIQQAVANAGLKPHQLSVVSGIGCSGRISGYLYAYGFHALHGRALPVAQGIKMGTATCRSLPAAVTATPLPLALAIPSMLFGAIWTLPTLLWIIMFMV